jgi:endonuclease/exonuclease/phosphatase (EEP) superfamily protein YafD
MTYPILAALAGALALVSVGAGLARAWWAFDMLAHFRLHYAVAALVLLVPALGLRAWWPALLLAGVAAFHLWTIKDLWLGGPAEAAAEGRPLRVAGANVLRSNETPGAVADWARAADADLLALVEAQGPHWEPVLRDLAALYPHRAPGGWQQGAPVILLSRHPIARARTIRPMGGQRPYLLAELAVDGTSLDMLVVHPSSPSGPAEVRERNRELAHLAEDIRATGRPTVLAGDFNTTPWSPHFRDLVETADLRLAAAGHGYIGTWPRSLWPARIPIDHILLRGELYTADFRRGPDIGSDHFPVIADLRMAE